jgi:branched-chain amino acid transport system substrate-binding protein
MKKRNGVAVFLGLFLILVLIAPSMVFAQTRGVAKDKIKVGAFQPLTGILAAEGKQAAEGARAYFSSINDMGGVNGRKFEYLVENDNYDPQQTMAATRKLVERDQIFAVVAPLGTATGMAVLPYLLKQNVPLIGSLSGSTALLNSKESLVFGAMLEGVVAGAAAAEWAIANIKPKKAAIFFQNDKFGMDGKDGMEQALKKAGVEIVDLAGHPTTDTDLSAMVLKVKQANPDTVFIYSIPKPTSMFLREAQKLGWKPNFVGANPLAIPDVGRLAGNAADGLKIVYYTALGDSTDPLVVEKVAILKKYAPDVVPGYMPFHGMLGALLTVEGFKKAGPEPTVESFIKGLETLKDFETGLVPPITYAPGKHAGATRFAVAEWKDGKLTVIKKW